MTGNVTTTTLQTNLRHPEVDKQSTNTHVTLKRQKYTVN